MQGDGELARRLARRLAVRQSRSCKEEGGSEGEKHADMYTAS